MLNFRFAMLITAAGICLWGLFQLLDSLSQPGLLRAEKTSVIKGCEALDSEETRSVCPQLFCQQAVLESELVSRKSRFAVTVDKEDGYMRLIGGEVSGKDPEDEDSSFACLLEDAKVVDMIVIDRAGLQDLAAQSGDWSFEEEVPPSRLATEADPQSPRASFQN